MLFLLFYCGKECHFGQLWSMTMCIEVYIAICVCWLRYVLSFCRGVKYHEPEYWKFGEEGNKYFRHATGQLYVVSKDLATYISINQYVFLGFFFLFFFLIGHKDDYWIAGNHHETWIKLFGLFFVSYRRILHKYANEDVSLGAWFIGLDVEQLDDRSFCCGTPPGVMMFMNK